MKFLKFLFLLPVSGENGCGLCYHPGVSMRYLKGHIRSYTLRQGEYPLRTHDEIMDMAVIAENEGTPRYDIVGKSVLSDISGFDVARCLDLDFFHALVNVSKRFAMLWFSRRLRKNLTVFTPSFKRLMRDFLKLLLPQTFLELQDPLKNVQITEDMNGSTGLWSTVFLY